MLVGGGTFSVTKGELKNTKETCYSLYSQGVKYKEIAQALDLPQTSVEYYVKSWACANSLPYPIYRGVGFFCYSLYKNNMKIKDIARLLGKKEINIYKLIHSFCSKYDIVPPFKKKAELAYKLRVEKNFSYSKIAKIVGYYDKSSCYHAISNYKQKVEK